MKEKKYLKTIAIICSILGIVYPLYMLLLGFNSVGKGGLSGIGVIFIMPCLLIIISIIIDILIETNKIKKGFIYSIIISIIRILIIIMVFPSLIYNYSYELRYGVSNFQFCLSIIIEFILISISSIINIIRLKKGGKK